VQNNIKSTAKHSVYDNQEKTNKTNHQTPQLTSIRQEAKSLERQKSQLNQEIDAMKEIKALPEPEGEKKRGLFNIKRKKSKFLIFFARAQKNILSNPLEKADLAEMLWFLFKTKT